MGRYRATRETAWKPIDATETADLSEEACRPGGFSRLSPNRRATEPSPLAAPIIKWFLHAFLASENRIGRVGDFKGAEEPRLAVKSACGSPG
jgi:hypothetical protein